MTIRNNRILHAIDTTKGIGLEVGPLSAPIVAKDAANIKYLDHMSQEELKEKYKDEPVDLDEICEVDYVLRGNSLANTVEKQKFDYIIASHVIEHVPDMVRWFEELASVMKPEGILSLAIPDKRFTFDINRRISPPSEVIGAYLDNYTRFSSAMMYDFASECLEEVDTVTAWDNPSYYANAKKKWTHEEIQEKCRRNLNPNIYIDCHCYVLTPASFIEILSSLIELGLFDFEVVYFQETKKNELEFYVSLKKIASNQKNKQIASLPIISTIPDKVSELEEQTDILKQDIHAIKHSLSWKLTKPLRKVRSVNRKGTT